MDSDTLESDINKSGISANTSLDSETTEDIITRFELNIACICEKLNNLNLLSMHVEMKESDFETIGSDMDPDLIIKTLEYDLLSCFLDSEMRILESCISDLQREKDNVHDVLYSKLGESVIENEEILLNSEKSLEQLMEQVSEIKTRSANFEKNLLKFSGNKDDNGNSLEFEEKVKMKIESVEHPRHVLRILSKSLETEIDLEKRVSELTQETETTLKNFYEKDHLSELLTETSKDLLNKIKMLQFNLKGSIHQEARLKNAIQKLEERATEEKRELREKVTEAENKVMDYDDKCRGLNTAYVKVVLLEKELNDHKVLLQHAEACCDASEEEKSMYLSTIDDMGNVIDELKKKVAHADVQNDNMEDRCILLSESNAELKKELKFVRGKVKILEKSLHQMEESKKASANDINLCSKFIADLVMQMKLERERLQKQISSLKQENKILLNCLKKKEKDSVVKVNHGDKASSNDFTAQNKETISTDFKVENACKETVTDSLDAARDIDARQLKIKEILFILLVLIIPLIGLFLNQTLVR